MAKQLEFFFDYVSPTAWLAFALAPKVAAEAGAELVWRPMFLGGVMQATGNRPPGMVAAKGAYMNDDLQRCAAHLGTEIHMNPAFPMNTRPALRATIGLGDGTPEQAAFRAACFTACWGQPGPLNIGEDGALAEVSRRAGLDPSAVAELAVAPENKDRLRANTDEAVARGVFGAPSFFVGDELFFGHDRLDYAARALAKLDQV